MTVAKPRWSSGCSERDVQPPELRWPKYKELRSYFITPGRDIGKCGLRETTIRPPSAGNQQNRPHFSQSEPDCLPAATAYLPVSAKRFEYRPHICQSQPKHDRIRQEWRVFLTRPVATYAARKHGEQLHVPRKAASATLPRIVAARKRSARIPHVRTRPHAAAAPPAHARRRPRGERGRLLACISIATA